MREKMARAIADRNMSIYADRLVEAKLTGTMRIQQFDEDHFQQLADACLDALLTPTEVMIYAASPETLGTSHPRDVFKAMISAAKSQA